MDLRLHHDTLVARREKFLRDGSRLVRRPSHLSFRHGHSVLGEELFGLEFVNVHFGSEFEVQLLEFEIRH